MGKAFARKKKWRDLRFEVLQRKKITYIKRNESGRGKKEKWLSEKV